MANGLKTIDSAVVDDQTLQFVLLRTKDYIQQNTGILSENTTKKEFWG